jgi:hypothetical protein
VTEQLALTGVLCECGCGQLVPHGRHGQARRFFSATHRARASRARAEGAHLSDVGVRAELAAVEAPSGLRWRSCPTCSTGQHHPCWLRDKPDVYVSTAGRGLCQCCGWQSQQASGSTGGPNGVGH